MQGRLMHRTEGRLRRGRLLCQTAVVVGRNVSFVLVGLLLAGCSGSTEQQTAPPPTSPTSAPPTVTRPLSIPQYQSVLSAIEQRLQPYVLKAMTAPTVAATQTTRDGLAAAMEREYKPLQKVVPPRAASFGHTLALETLAGSSKLRREGPVANSVRAPECGVAASAAEMLADIRGDIFTDAFRSYGTNGSNPLAHATSELAKSKISFGRLLAKVEPANPPLLTRRGVNAKVIQRSGPRGSGRLRIDNESPGDLVVAAMADDPRRPLASIYVRSSSSATLSGIRGQYTVYFKSGTDWDAKRGTFTRSCDYYRYLRSFDDRSTSQITIAATIAGGPGTSRTSPF